MMLVPVLEFFVPLTGRIGADAPADHVIATIVSVVGSLSLPLTIPATHRFGRPALKRGVLFLSIVTVLMMAVFARRVPFDAMHQKRLFVLHTENITTHEHHLHISAADGAPGLELLVRDIAKEFGSIEPGANTDALAPILMDGYNSDWDSLYPFSAFLTPYKIPLTVDPGYISPWEAESRFTITAVNDVKDLVAGTRSLTLRIDHPGLIWTVIAFDAHVLEWTLDDNPPNEYARHHVKEASFYGKDTWTLDLVIKLNDKGDSTDGTLNINFIGIQEKGMWPGKKAVKEQGGVAMKLFEQLDAWVDERTQGTVDPTLMGCVAGVTRV